MNRNKVKGEEQFYKSLANSVKTVSIFFGLTEWQSLKLVASLGIFGYLYTGGFPAYSSLLAMPTSGTTSLKPGEIENLSCDQGN